MKFTIRDLLWLTAVVAILLTWWLDRGQLEANRSWHERQNKANYQELIQVKKTVERIAARNGMPNPFAPAPNSPKP
jgi:hypothetical protein